MVENRRLLVRDVMIEVNKAETGREYVAYFLLSALARVTSLSCALPLLVRDLGPSHDRLPRARQGAVAENQPRHQRGLPASDSVARKPKAVGDKMCSSVV
jgi:hypothetical protein